MERKCGVVDFRTIQWWHVGANIDSVRGLFVIDFTGLVSSEMVEGDACDG